MHVRAIDHVNLQIPVDGIETAVEFYDGLLGFDVENLELYESGEKGFFSFRLTETSVFHMRPMEDFQQPSGHSYDHVALLIDDPVDDVKQTLADAGVEIEKELEPLGATGVAPAIYVTDPFGYTIEIKEAD